MNLKNRNNFDLRLRVLVEAVTPSQLCSMTEDVGLAHPRNLLPRVSEMAAKKNNKNI